MATQRETWDNTIVIEETSDMSTDGIKLTLETSIRWRVDIYFMMLWNKLKKEEKKIIEKAEKGKNNAARDGDEVKDLPLGV